MPREVTDEGWIPTPRGHFIVHPASGTMMLPYHGTYRYFHSSRLRTGIATVDLHGATIKCLSDYLLLCSKQRRRKDVSGGEKRMIMDKGRTRGEHDKGSDNDNEAGR